mgnify:CR=1 FL=1
MASWTNLSIYIPGITTSSSNIDQIFDNITVLAGHNHSGSAGEGNVYLSPNAKLSNANSVGESSPRYYLNHFMPGSNAGWSLITPRIDTTVIHERTMLVINDSSSAGACAGWNTLLADELTVDVSFVTRFIGGPTGGCVLLSWNATGGFGTSLTASPAEISTYSAASILITQTYTYHVATPASGTLKLKTTGKDTSSTAFGASLAGISSV